MQNIMEPSDFYTNTTEEAHSYFEVLLIHNFITLWTSVSSVSRTLGPARYRCCRIGLVPGLDNFCAR